MTVQPYQADSFYSNNNATQLSMRVRKFFIESSSADSIKQALSLANYLLSIVTCSGAPNCLELNRNNCSLTANTCGSCISSSYFGEDGDRNTRCYSLATPTTTSMRLYKKSCPADCSGHGSCVYVMQDTGLISTSQDSCLIMDQNCNAVCDCDEGFIGSDTCSVTSIEFRQKQNDRLLVLQQLQSLVDMENPDQQVIESWVNTLSQCSLSSSELNVQASSLVFSLIDYIITISSDMTFLYSSQLLSSLNTATKAHSSTILKQSLARRRAQRALISSDEAWNSTDALLSSLDRFSKLTVKYMLPSQYPSEYILSEFRLSVQVLPKGYLPTGIVTILRIPRTSSEKLFGQPASSVTVPYSMNQSIQVVMMLISSALYSGLESELKSDPLKVSLSPSPCVDNLYQDCKITLSLQNTVDYGLSKLNNGSGGSDAGRYLSDGEYHSVDCDAGEYSNHTVVCSSGEAMELQCKGIAGTLEQQCPVIKYSGTCNSLSNDHYMVSINDASDDSGCSVDAYSETNVSCSCSIDSSSTSSGVYSKSYVSMLTSTTSSPISSFIYADDSSATTTVGWIARITIMALITLSSLLLLCSYYFDSSGVKGADSKAIHPLQLLPSTIVTPPSPPSSSSSSNASQSKELGMVDSALPFIFRSALFTDRLIQELRIHHRWFRWMFGSITSTQYRMMAVVSMASQLFIVLFVLSLVYSLDDPEQQHCDQYHHRDACLSSTSSYDSHETSCEWMSHTGKCKSIEADERLVLIVYIAILCSLVSSPVVLLSDWLLQRFIFAPINDTDKEKDAKNIPPGSVQDGISTSSHSRPSIYCGLMRDKGRIEPLQAVMTESSTAPTILLDDQVQTLFTELQSFRQRISTTDQRSQFDCE